ncbi:MAG: glycosyl transferase family 1, partial [Gemmatimonadaceae bacterium]|nr:glycosyl transferase family 1 [Acetobacteraceae bacterium]
MIDMLDTDAAIHALAPEWEALWRSVPGASPFTAPAWLMPFWRHFGTGMPRVAVQRDGGRLTGVLPLYVLDEPGGPKLLPFGAGITDQIDALLAPGTAPASLLQAALDRAR